MLYVSAYDYERKTSRSKVTKEDSGLNLEYSQVGDLQTTLKPQDQTDSSVLISKEKITETIKEKQSSFSLAEVQFSETTNVKLKSIRTFKDEKELGSSRSKRDEKEGTKTNLDEKSTSRSNKDEQESPRANLDEKTSSRSNRDEQESTKTNLDEKPTSRSNRDERESPRANLDEKTTARSDRDEQESFPSSYSSVSSSQTSAASDIPTRHTNRRLTLRGF